MNLPASVEILKRLCPSDPAAKEKAFEAGREDSSHAGKPSLTDDSPRRPSFTERTIRSSPISPLEES